MAPFLILQLLILLFATNTSQSAASTNNHGAAIECPTWYRGDGDSSECVCGDALDGKVKCLRNEQVSLAVGNCMTSTETSGEAVVGLCPYLILGASLVDDFYTTLPKNASELDDFVCGGVNRTGLLCSRCREGLSLAAMSYQRQCIACGDNLAGGIATFVTLLLVPSMIFFLIVMLCSVDISSGPMNALLTVLQLNISWINQNPWSFIFNSSNSLAHYFVLFILTFYGIWNLDFLRYVLPSFCISHSLTTLQAQGLEYAITLYPLLLVILTYVAVELYDNEYCVMVALWTPFKKIFNFKCIKHLNVKRSLITTFAAFLQLIYTRMLFISKEILNYSELKNSTGDTVDRVLAMDASV
jgi:hypothetical protein